VRVTESLPPKSIFLCYRRTDSEDVVGRIYDSLVEEFGEAAIFRDIDVIPESVDFRVNIQEVLRVCHAALVFIGHDWASCTDGRGRQRLYDPGDHVRIEVETALALPVARVIPVFVKFASVPSEEELPESIRPLLRRSGITVRGESYYEQDVARLAKHVGEAVMEVAAVEGKLRQGETLERQDQSERELAERGRVELQERRAAEAHRQPSSAEFGLRSLAAGKLVAGRFRLEKLLGRGGMGVVWRARDEELRKPRALKFLKEELAGDPGAIAALKDEVGRCQDLSHRHIIRLFDLVKDDALGLVAVSMEVAEGGNLTDRRLEKPQRWLEPEELLPWAGQLCEALAYIHEEAELVHRDLKPANLLLDHRDRLKLSDFGISGSLTDSLSRLTGEHPSSGTPAYMSPEQARGKAPHPSDDLYSLGATLYELLTGQPPFTGSPSAVLAQLLSDTLAPSIAARRLMIENVSAPVSESWEDAIAALLAKKAADRPGSAGEVMESLRTSADRRDKNLENRPQTDSTLVLETQEFPNPDAENSGPSLAALLRLRRELPAGETLLLGESLADALDIAAVSAGGQMMVRLEEMKIQFSGAPSEAKAYAILGEPVTTWPKFRAFLKSQPANENTVLGGGKTMLSAAFAGDKVQVFGRILYEMLGGVAGGGASPLASLNENGNLALQRGIGKGTSAFPRARDLIDVLLAESASPPGARRKPGGPPQIIASPLAEGERKTPTLPGSSAPRRSRRALVWGALATLVLAAGAAYHFIGEHAGTPTPKPATPAPASTPPPTPAPTPSTPVPAPPPAPKPTPAPKFPEFTPAPRTPSVKTPRPGDARNGTPNAGKPSTDKNGPVREAIERQYRSGNITRDQYLKAIKNL